jgi:hypothetical protein
MPDDDGQPLGPIEREIQIMGLKKEAAELAGGQMDTWESEDCPPEVAEQFWQNVVAYESASWTTHFDQLVRAGMEIPGPAEMDDEQLAGKLRELIDRLAALRVFLTSTDHLSNRELYTHLWNESLRQEVKDLPPDAYSAWHIDLVGSGSEEDINLYLRYYADEEDRNEWAGRYPEEAIPPREDPPYDRDRYLPQATYGPPPDGESGL